MKLKFALFALFAVCLFVGDVDADWRFWRSKKKDEATTVAPITTNPDPARTTSAAVQPSGGTQPVSNNQGRPVSTSTNANTNTNKAIAGAADPGLAIGIGSTGTNIRNNAQPNRPNPGTEVGQDFPGSRPANRPGTGDHTGQGYRDWAADLTGAGEGRQPAPRLPTQGPAIFGGGQQPVQRPGTPTGQPIAGQPAGGHPANGQPAQSGQHQPGSRPGTPTANGPAVQVGQPGSTPGPVTTRGPQGVASDGRPQVSTLNIGSLHPGSRPGSPTSSIGNTPQNRPGSPSATTGGTSPTGGKTWAEIAATGTRPQSPTPATRTGTQQGGQSPQSGQPGQASMGQTRPSQIPIQPYGQPGHQGGQQPPRSGSPMGGSVAAGAAGAAAGAVGGAVGKKVFSSNPTYSKGNTVTDEDLQKLAESLFIKDVNNANRFITLNLQKRTSSNSPTDEAPQPLLTVQPAALQIPTIQKVISLYNNYEHDTRTNEYVSPAERAEESLLVDTFLSTNVMSSAMRFLADKGFIRKDYYEYKDTLRRLWFNLYSRGDGKIGSSGFEHVFLSELKQGTELIGLHNWIYLYTEEGSNRANYLGYIKKLDLGDKGSIVKVHLKLNDVVKPVTTIFIGTSPELEMALYTVCFFTRPDAKCPVSLGGTPFNIVTHKFRYRGKDLIGNAQPDIESTAA